MKILDSGFIGEYNKNNFEAKIMKFVKSYFYFYFYSKSSISR